MKINKRLASALAAIISLLLAVSPAMADVPYVNSGAVTMSAGSPYIYILNLVGQSSCTVASSTGSGTVAIEVSQDGIVWTALNITTPSGTSAMTLALPGVGTSSVAAFANARAHLTAGAGGPVYFACGAGVGFTTASGGVSSAVTVTNFPANQNINLFQTGGAAMGAATAAGTSATGNILGIQGVTGGVPIATSVTFPSSIAVTQSTSPWVSSIPAGVSVNNFPATQPVSGTVTANAGTGFPSATAAGTSGTSLTTIQGSVSGVPIPVTGTFTPSGTQNVNQLQLGGAILGAATAIGTSASGLVQGVQGTAGGFPLPVSGSVSVNGTGTAGTPNAGVVTIQGITGGTAINVTSTGSNPLKTVLTSASATACTNIEVSTTGSVVELVNSSSSGLSVTLNLYDEGASPTCANADLMFSVQMAASQVILLNVPVAAGISYSLSSALTAGGNITVTRR